MDSQQKDLAVGRTVSLRLSEWQKLQELSPVGSATREATEVLRRHLERIEKTQQNQQQ